MGAILLDGKNASWTEAGQAHLRRVVIGVDLGVVHSPGEVRPEAKVHDDPLSRDKSVNPELLVTEVADINSQSIR